MLRVGPMLRVGVLLIGGALLIGGLLLTATAAHPAGAQESAEISPGTLEVARERVVDHPRDPAAHIALGHALYDRERFHDALASFKTAVSLDPGNLEALVNAGVLHLETGHPVLALSALASAREIEPEDPLLLINLARAHEALGETAAAVDCLVAALGLDPDSQPAHFHLGVLFAEAGIYAEAIREFEAVVDADPESPAAQQAKTNLSRLSRMIQDEAR